MADTNDYQRIAAHVMKRERNLPKLVSSDYYWQRKRREVVELIKRNRHRFQDARHFVELGCGEGRDVWSIRAALGLPDLQFECVDANEADLELARARQEFHEANDVAFQQADITGRLPWDTDSVDIVYTSEVFEHIPQIDPLVAEIARIVKHGGHMILTTPNEPNVFQPSFYSKKRRRANAARNARPVHTADDGTPLYGHVTLKKNGEWDALMAEHGFRLLDHGRGSVWYGGTEMHDNGFVLALQFGLDATLDLLPRRLIRNVSDQVIALYERR